MTRHLLTLLTLVLAVAAVAQAAEPPYDVQARRKEYFDKLDAKEAQLINERINHDENGQVIFDQDYIDAREDFVQYEKQLRQEYRMDTGRDQHLDDIFNRAGLEQGSLADTGTPPGSDEYRGPHSDRDMTASSTKDVNRIAQAARDAGYTVRPDHGKIYIVELDTTVWDPDYFKVKGETVQKRTSLNETISRLNDPEVILGHEGPGVGQQVKKVETHYRGDAPVDTAGQAKFAQELGKATHKTQKALGAADPTSPAARLKAGQDPRIVLNTFGHPPEVKQQLLTQYRDETVTKALAEGLAADRKARKSRMEKLVVDARDARAAAANALDQGKLAEAKLKQQQAADADAKLRRARQIDAGDEATLRVLARKNPTIREKIIDPANGIDDAPPVTRMGRLRKAGVGIGGAIIVIYDAYNRESTSAQAQGREFSQANLTGQVVLNVTGINGAIDASKGLYRESYTGTQAYIKQQIERYKAHGVDTTTLQFKLALLLRASARGTIRGSYEGAKGLPLLGDAIGAVETIAFIGQEGYGLASDVLESQAIREANRLEQAATDVEALASAGRLEDRLRALAAKVAAQQQVLTKLATASDKLAAVTDEIRDALAECINPLETLAQRPAADADSLGSLFTTFDSVTAGANKLADAARAPQAATAALGHHLQPLRQEFDQANAKVTVLQAAAKPNDVERITALQTRAVEALGSMQRIAEGTEAALKQYNTTAVDLRKTEKDFQDTRERFDRAWKYFWMRVGNGSAQQGALQGLLNRVREIKIDTKRTQELLTKRGDVQMAAAVAKKIAQRDIPQLPASDANARQTASEKLPALLAARDSAASALTSAELAIGNVPPPAVATTPTDPTVTTNDVDALIQQTLPPGATLKEKTETEQFQGHAVTSTFTCYVDPRSGKEVKHGHITGRYDNGRLAAKGLAINDKPHGTLEMYYYNGNRSLRGTMNRGEPVGLQEAWHENGQKMLDDLYSDTGVHISMKAWGPNGRVGKEVTCWPNGESKLETIYYENGKVRRAIAYADDGRVLKAERFNDDGFLYQLAEFNPATGVLTTQRFGLEGDRTEGRIKDDKEISFKAWHKNGQLVDERSYHQTGKLKRHTRWRPDGSLSSRNSYDEQGRPHGRAEQFDYNGKLRSVLVYNQGRRVSQTVYGENGESRTTTFND